MKIEKRLIRDQKGKTNSETLCKMVILFVPKSEADQGNCWFQDSCSDSKFH